ncbi:MAG: hypothetical protein UZ12_BCD005001866 [Bacteroidetes bacterium OLB12]|nr:MAG: hypothetical protein UZ12_BCD005001866 [Bacteroidetes bacterium OLB12]HNR74990.1 hypothetical protein [Cyclobacteriaceae bacterium]HNU42200.1 hypothetical protein [Cyclobacteriaceae bacterium]
MYQRDLDLQRRWQALLAALEKTVTKKPKDLNGVLFLIGMQELGRGPARFTKEEKQDLMHIAICKVLSLAGYYTLEGQDEQGWPHWKLVKKLPHFDLLEQEKLLKMHVVEYFETEYGWQLSEDSNSV